MDVLKSNKIYLEINYLFNSIENKNKKESWKMEEFNKIINNIQKESYKKGQKNGANQLIELLQNHPLK